MLVSVVIPAYNVESCISECLNSVLGQTYKDIEIICVDDCSHDSTLSILESYKKNHPSLILLKNDSNKGAPYSRNYGMDVARGEYIQFLDADDLLMSEKIKRQVELIAQSSVAPDFVAGNEFWEKADGTCVLYHQFIYDHWHDLIRGTLGDTCSNLWRKESLKKIGKWNEALKSSQEFELLFRFLKAEAKILYDPEPFTIIRQRKKGSISTHNKKGNISRMIEITLDVKNYLAEKKLLTPDLLNALNKKLLYSIKELYRHDKHSALNYFDAQMPRSFLLSAVSGSSLVHRFFYYILGFNITESLIVRKNKTI